MTSPLEEPEVTTSTKSFYCSGTDMATAASTSVDPNSSGAKKKHIVKSPDGSARTVASLVLQHVFRQVILVPSSAKIGLMLVVLIFGSILCDFGSLPTGYWSSKSNFLNVYFAKFGWGWTFAATFTYIIASHYVMNSGKIGGILRRVVRLTAATACWFVITYAFQMVEYMTGYCVEGNYSTKGQCRSFGHEWIAFDPSGHVFLLAFCVLTITEELQDLPEWEKTLRRLESSPSERQGDSARGLNAAFLSSRPYVLAWPAILIIVWLLCFVLTTLFYHSLAQKFIGFIFAVASWFVAYRLRPEQFMDGGCGSKRQRLNAKRC